MVSEWLIIKCLTRVSTVSTKQWGFWKRADSFLWTLYQFLLTQISRTNFRHQTGYFWKVLINKYFKTSENQEFYCRPFSFNLNVEHLEIYKFHLQNCLSIPIEEQIFGTKLATSGKFQSELNSKTSSFRSPPSSI